MSSRGCYGAGGRSGTAQLAHETKNYPELMSATVQVRMTDPHLKEFVAATGALNAARRHRCMRRSPSRSPPGIPSTSWRLRPVCHRLALSRMIRQDTARSPDRRLLARTPQLGGSTGGPFDGFVAPPPPQRAGRIEGSDRFRQRLWITDCFPR